MLLWAAIAKRPLSIMEMREAIAVRLRQTELRESQLVTDVESMVGWCNSLLIMDEDDRIVQFAHYSIKDSLQNLNSILSERGLDLNIQESVAIFHISEERKTEIASQVCCTYLSYEAFENRNVLVSTRPTDAPLKAKPDLQPMNIAKSSLITSSNNALVLRSWSLLERCIRKRRTTQVIAEDLSQRRTQLEESGSLMHKLQESHHFLAYASEFWLEHTTSLRKENPVWEKFEALVTQDRTVAIKPEVAGWIWAGWNHDFFMLEYACRNEHIGLLCLSKTRMPLNVIARDMMRTSRPFFERFLTEDKGEGYSLPEFTVLVKDAISYDRPDIAKRLLGPVQVQRQEAQGDFRLRYIAMTSPDELRYDEMLLAGDICGAQVHQIINWISRFNGSDGMKLADFVALVNHPRKGPYLCEICVKFLKSGSA